MAAEIIDFPNSKQTDTHKVLAEDEPCALTINAQTLNAVLRYVEDAAKYVRSSDNIDRAMHLRLVALISH